MAEEAPQTPAANAMAPMDAAHPTEGTHATTEAAGGHEAFPPFDPNTFGNQLVWLALSFVVLYFVLSRMALPRIGSILEDRKGRIDSDLAAADASRQKTDAAIATYEAALADARKTSQALADETRSKIRADIDAKRKAVEDDLGHRVAEAEARIGRTKAEALGHVTEIAVDTAQALVTQLTGSASSGEVAAAVASVAKE